MENFKDDWGDDAIEKISGKELTRYLVAKRQEKICKCLERIVIVDSGQRKCFCSECGAILDPFDVLNEITIKDHMRYDWLKYLKEENEKLERWKNNNRMGSALREIASEIRQGKVPVCPHCREPFDLENLNTFCSKSYAVAHQEAKMQKLANKAKDEVQNDNP